MHGGLDVTPLVLLDPAPFPEGSGYGSEPEDGTRLIAVRWSMTNTGSEDTLIGPVGTTHFIDSNGKRYDDSLIETSAGAMFDQLRLAPRQTMVGFTTAEIPEKATVDKIEFTAGYGPEDEVLTWDTAGQAVKEAPALPSRRGDGPKATPLGTEREIAGGYDGEDFSLRLTATKITDPVEPRGEIYPRSDRRLLAVDFTVRNDGKTAYKDEEDDADLRVFAVHNAQDEAFTSHVYGAFAEKGPPLSAGEEDKWTIIFEVPTDFKVDRVSFSPAFGDRVATIWTVN